MLDQIKAIEKKFDENWNSPIYSTITDFYGRKLLGNVDQSLKIKSFFRSKLIDLLEADVERFNKSWNIAKDEIKLDRNDTINAENYGMIRVYKYEIALKLNLIKALKQGEGK